MLCVLRVGIVTPSGGNLESTIRREVEAIGFRLIAEGDFWHHPKYVHDFSALRPTGPVDEFADFNEQRRENPV
jgi:hypothetical protein